MEVLKLFEVSKSNDQLLTIEATVDTGFENVALEECREKFGSSTTVVTSRGRIYCNISPDQFHVLRLMRSIDNINLISDVITDLGFQSSSEENKDVDLELIKQHVTNCDWKKYLEIWKRCVNFSGILFPTQEEYQESLNIKLKKKEPLVNGSSEQENVKDNNLVESDSVLKYRVTCYRSGKHSFMSMEAARDYGGKLQDLFLWLVDLTDYDLEVILNIIQNQAYVALALTKESMHKRNITHFGPTTLRATVCYNLLHLAEPKVGDIVIDPLCGGGSISIEGCLGFSGTFHLCGDFHDKAVTRSLLNMQSVCKRVKSGKSLLTDVLKWDATRLPLRTGSVDVFVTDLPFGKRSGYKKDNKVLYRDVLLELGRVVTPETGRAVLLTHDKRSFEIMFPSSKQFWKQQKILGVNLGGLRAGVFVLLRTSKLWIK